MTRLRPAPVLLALLVAWAIAVWPAFSEQWNAGRRMLKTLGGKPLDERSSLLDYPAYPVARQIAAAVPADDCVIVLAYAGPAAVEYYAARFDYLLYPREVNVTADPTVPFEACPYVAVFQDSEQNLAAEPFRGAWDSAALQSRLEPYERVAYGSVVSVYRAR